jgi:hypothetical protein
MRPARIAAVPLVLSLAVVFACKESTTGNTSGAITCSAADAAVCPPSNLSLGFNGGTGTPTIAPSNSSTGFSVGTSGFSAAGATSSTTNGYWFLVVGGTLRAWGIVTVSGAAFLAQIPLFCGAQGLIYRFDNASGHSYWFANVTLTGCTTAGFRAQLTWDTGPANSDLDLHLVRPSGSTNTSNDCYYSNCTPFDTPLDWGVSGSAGDPQLDVDNTDGYGPENITLTGAETGTYRVIVRNFNGVASTRATVKVFFNDVEQARWTSVALDSPNNYWTVANVDILNHVVTAVNTYSSTAPVVAGVAAGVEARIKRIR